MSKLIEKLERTTEAQVMPLGFGAARARQKSAPMLVIARLSGPESKTIKSVQDVADALLAPVGSWDKTGTSQMRHLAKAAGDTPWGVVAAGLTSQNVATLVELGCDFVVFGESETQAAVLDSEKIGKVIEVDASDADSLLRVVERLQVGAVMSSLGEMSSLTVHQVLVCQRVAALVRKPLLVPAPADIAAPELQALCRAGVRGLVVDAEIENGRELISKLKESIASLPAQKKTSGEKFHATLPSISEPAAKPEEDDEEEEG
ncbi:MAG: hypothetical protein Q7T04_04640 [Dehalococcoidia bacterium]|nr:hypothetical protein [Dehalococcoidia bacterium]